MSKGGRAPEGPEPCPITGCDRTFLTVGSANIHQQRMHGGPRGGPDPMYVKLLPRAQRVRRRMMKDPAFRQRLKDAVTPENRQHKSEAAQRAWQRGEYRQRQEKAQRGNAKNSATWRAKWADPEWRAKMMAARPAPKTHCMRGHPKPPGDWCRPCSALRTRKYRATHRP